MNLFILHITKAHIPTYSSLAKHGASSSVYSGQKEICTTKLESLKSTRTQYGGLSNSDEQSTSLEILATVLQISQ